MWIGEELLTHLLLWWYSLAAHCLSWPLIFPNKQFLPRWGFFFFFFPRRAIRAMWWPRHCQWPFPPSSGYGRAQAQLSVNWLEPLIMQQGHAGAAWALPCPSTWGAKGLEGAQPSGCSCAEIFNCSQFSSRVCPVQHCSSVRCISSGELTWLGTRGKSGSKGPNEVYI